MTIAKRLRQLASALPSDDAAVTITRADLSSLLEEEAGGPVPSRDMTVEEVAGEVGRAPSTVRGWLLPGELRGPNLNGRDRRVPHPALMVYLSEDSETDDFPAATREIDITAWRSVRGTPERSMSGASSPAWPRSGLSGYGFVRHRVSVTFAAAQIGPDCLAVGQTGRHNRRRAVHAFRRIPRR